MRKENNTEEQEEELAAIGESTKHKAESERKK